MEVPEHPEIAQALATGYPHRERPDTIHCDDCDRILSGEDSVYDWAGNRLCEKCVRDRIEENICVQTIAEALGIAWKAAYLMEGE